MNECSNQSIQTADQPRRDRAHLLCFQRPPTGGSLLTVVGIDVVRNHRIVGDDEIVLQAALVGEIVGGDGQTGRNRQRLPVHSRRQRRSPHLFSASTKKKKTKKQKTTQRLENWIFGLDQLDSNTQTSFESDLLTLLYQIGLEVDRKSSQSQNRMELIGSSWHQLLSTEMNQIDTCSPVAPHSSVKLGFVGRYLAGFILQRPTRKRNKLEVEIHPETGQRSFDHFPLNGWMVECNTHPVISLVIEASAPKDFDAILSSVAAWKWCCWIRTPDGPISSKQGGGVKMN